MRKLRFRLCRFRVRVYTVRGIEVGWDFGFLILGFLDFRGLRGRVLVLVLSFIGICGFERVI